MDGLLQILTYCFPNVPVGVDSADRVRVCCCCRVVFSHRLANVVGASEVEQHMLCSLDSASQSASFKACLDLIQRHIPLLNATMICLFGKHVLVGARLAVCNDKDISL